VKQIHLLRLF
jgi:hypothetical protein